MVGCIAATDAFTHYEDSRLDSRTDPQSSRNWSKSALEAMSIAKRCGRTETIS